MPWEGVERNWNSLWELLEVSASPKKQQQKIISCVSYATTSSHSLVPCTLSISNEWMNGQCPLAFTATCFLPVLGSSCHHTNCRISVQSPQSFLSSAALGTADLSLSPLENPLRFLWLLWSALLSFFFCMIILSLPLLLWSFNGSSPIPCSPTAGTSRYQSEASGLLSLYRALVHFCFTNKYNCYSNPQIYVSRVNLFVKVSSI